MFVATFMGALVVGIVGYFVAPIITCPFALIVAFALRPVSAPFAAFVGKFGTFTLETYLFWLAVRWAIGHFHLVGWPLWLVFALTVFQSFNTLAFPDQVSRGLRGEL